MSTQHRKYNDVYVGDWLNHVAFPLGGIGAGMICLEGAGALSHFSIRNRPDVFNEPCVFSAIKIKGGENVARVLEGPVPKRKIFGHPGTGRGCRRSTFGLPRFSSALFKARFPFATVSLEDVKVPLRVEIIGWSPFIPGDADNSSLPVAALEYRFKNLSDRPIDAVYSFNAMNFMATGSGGEAVLSAPNGFTLWQPGSEGKPWEEGAFCASVDGRDAKVNCAWFRGAWYDPITMAWKDIKEGNCVAKPPISVGAPAEEQTSTSPCRSRRGKKKRSNSCFHGTCPKPTCAMARIRTRVKMTQVPPVVAGKERAARGNCPHTSPGIQADSQALRPSPSTGETTMNRYGKRVHNSVIVFMTRPCHLRSLKL